MKIETVINTIKEVLVFVQVICTETKNELIDLNSRISALEKEQKVQEESLKKIVCLMNNMNRKINTLDERLELLESFKFTIEREENQ